MLLAWMTGGGLVTCFAACSAATKTATPAEPATSEATMSSKGAPPPPRARADESSASWANTAALEADCRARLDRIGSLRKSIVAPSPSATTVPLLATLNVVLSDIDRGAGIAGLVAQVHPEKAVRDAALACERELRTASNDLNMDRALFDALASVDGKDLDPSAGRFVEKTVRDFRRAGVDKDEPTRATLKKLYDEMVELGQTFARNISDDVRSMKVDGSRLAGLPEDFLRSRAPDDKGLVTLTTAYPDFFPVQQYAEDESLRRDLDLLFYNRAHPANDEILLRLLKARRAYASLLGFSNWAEYMADDKMVGSAKAIEKFLAEVTKLARPRTERDLRVLLARKRKDDPKAQRIQDWDRLYYTEKVRSETLGFDARAAREYFEVSRVVQGVLDLYAELFGAKFVEVDAQAARPWHASVRAFDLIIDHAQAARFYLDLYPREGKYGHAAVFPMVTGLRDGPIAEAALICNFPDPSKTSGPALLEHKEVVTFFHEFGHLMHHLLARDSRWVNQAGISVEADFVEAPSQLLEEWAWDPEVLGRFATHHQTGRPIPRDLVKKMKDSSEFGKGVHVMRQLFLSALSYDLHVLDPSDLDLVEALRAEHDRFGLFPYVDGTHFYANFGHLEGYSSMYYTYQWSLVLAKDLFTRFEARGLLDAETARAYREEVLVPGGSRPATTMVEAFLGRPYSLAAYQRWLEEG